MVAHILIAELLDEIFEYLDAHDIHTCLFVSRQFYTRAIQFIYRNIDLQGGANPLYSPSEKSKVLNTPCFIANDRSLSKHKTTFGKLSIVILPSLGTYSPSK
jgi:hypothetical protein